MLLATAHKLFLAQTFPTPAGERQFFKISLPGSDGSVRHAYIPVEQNLWDDLAPKSREETSSERGR